MTRQSITDSVLSLVRSHAPKDSWDSVNVHSKKSDLAFDSLDTMELILAIETNFEIRLDQTSAAQWTTVKDLVDMVAFACGLDTDELPLGDPRKNLPPKVATPAGMFDLDQLAEEAYVAYGKRTHAPSQFTSRWNQLTPVGKEAWRDAVRSVVTTILS